MSFEDLIQLPTFERKGSKRKKVFKGYWMTTDENFAIVKRIETETGKKEADKKRKNNAVVARRKKKEALKKGKAKKNNKIQPQTVNCALETSTSILPDWLR